MLNEKPGTDRYQEYYSKQYTYKVLLNSWYGILNSHYCILQDRRISDSITWLGREIIKWGKQNNWKKYIVIDPQFKRPAEVPVLKARPEKAIKNLNWKPKVSFDSLVKMMVEADLKRYEK